MNMLRMMNLAKKQPFMKMFTRKKSNKGFLWASLLSLGASAAVWGMTRGKKMIPNQQQPQSHATRTESNRTPFQNMFKNLTINKNISTMNDAALTEFSEELINQATQTKK
ncbi:MAG: hypothetical protein Q8934_05965 [Bacillota bacterium]|nr:hypothetical protein [Bacillota bacterium]